MSLRILGGTFRNRPIKSPKGEETRPTLAIVRKAVFDIVQFQIEGSAFLDIFAGSGAMGIEALSRGAASATFIDQSRLATRCIQENLTLLKQEGAILGFDALSALKKLAKAERLFDIIYIDPPYKTTLLFQVLHFLDEHPLLKPGGVIFAEEEAPGLLKGKNPPLKRLALTDSRTFGRSVLHQFKTR